MCGVIHLCTARDCKGTATQFGEWKGNGKVENCELWIGIDELRFAKDLRDRVKYGERAGRRALVSLCSNRAQVDVVPTQQGGEL